MAASTGTPKVPEYIFAEKIGSGSFADVYKAYKKGKTREVTAIKCVLKSNLSKTALDNLILEIKILKELKHEHIVEMKDFEWDDKYIYIIMEYCSGGDLSNFVKSTRRLPETVCQRFLQQLAAALKYMREKKVSHFDLKPSNILLKSRSNPILKIGDFGLAQHLPEDDTNSTIKGSPLYMAPEIVLKHQYDAKVDLWSVGVILYECLFGKAPYSSKTMNELIEKIKKDKAIDVPYGTNISQDCRNLLQCCLERDVSKRIDFEGFFSHPFVDLEHKPSPESMTKATELLTMAVNFDECQEYEEAFRHYNQALQYLVPLLHVEGDASKRTALRRKISEYLSRTEDLKKIMNNDSETIRNIRIPTIQRQESTGSTEYQGNREELLRLTATTPQIQTAIEIAASGELYANEGSYATAFEKYQLALGKLLELLQSEPKGRRKDLLREEVTRWMSQAEHLKEVLNRVTSPGNYTEELFVMADDKNCSLQ
ncbi:serine/threonine-protein kinase ULK3-like [Homarus americanus]|uniref:Serine/threonine-protein kinase ULK3 n=1 Tax=Homarus americanus TaxID=6706 RepID=A0A8J5JYF0_HOMAM|nr:serine/threonine-protein kinase ULK3-like [Homarus americanus]KAG7164343.1 Serine/threonine-protein kinase ULK3-like [Homarus americanus]